MVATGDGHPGSWTSWLRTIASEEYLRADRAGVCHRGETTEQLAMFNGPEYGERSGGRPSTRSSR
jgi:hypothetical protein